MQTVDVRGEWVANPEGVVIWPGVWQLVRAVLVEEDRPVIAEWEVSNPAVATVHVGRYPDGRELADRGHVYIEALASGVVTITASYGSEDATAQWDLTVDGRDFEVVAERSLVDRPDEVAGPQVHAVYVIPNDGLDENMDRHGRIGWSLNTSVDFLTYKLGRRLRVDTYNGEPDVTFLRLEENASELSTADVAVRVLREAIESTSWFSDNEEKTYAVYYVGVIDRGQAFGGGRVATVLMDPRGVKLSFLHVPREPGVLALWNT